MLRDLRFRADVWPLIFGDDRGGRLVRRSFDQVLGVREPAAPGRDLAIFYETWVLAKCPSRPTWYRDDPYVAVAESLLETFYFSYGPPRGLDVLYGYSVSRHTSP